MSPERDASSSTRAKSGEKPAKKSRLAKKQVLVITDMQKDYDIQANIKLYGEVRSPYANNISPLVPKINQIRRSIKWDKVVFTMDWLEAELLAGRTPFCMENTVGAELLDELEVDKDVDVCFKKNSDDSFCLEGGRPEGCTGCSRLGEVLSGLGCGPETAALVFVGQRFERCVLKTVVHARDLGYESTIVDEATYTKTLEPDPEWSLGAPDASSASELGHTRSNVDQVPEWAADVYLRAKKSAGRRLAERYLTEAGASIMGAWPEVPEPAL